MKITTFKLIQITILFSVLILLTLAKQTNKNNRKHKGKRAFRHSRSQNIANPIPNKSNPNNNTPKQKEDPIVTAKNKCTTSCKNELKEYQKGVQKQDRAAHTSEANLYIKKKEEDTEYYLCECLLSDDTSILHVEYYFANKINVELFYKNDDDGRKVYKKSIKKGLSESDSKIYQLA